MSDYEGYTEDRLKIKGDKMTAEQFLQFLVANLVRTNFTWARWHVFVVPSARVWRLFTDRSAGELCDDVEMSYVAGVLPEDVKQDALQRRGLGVTPARTRLASSTRSMDSMTLRVRAAWPPNPSSTYCWSCLTQPTRPHTCRF